jgi:hypothetical protein
MLYSNGLGAISATYYNTATVAEETCQHQKKVEPGSTFLASLPSIL